MGQTECCAESEWLSGTKGSSLHRLLTLALVRLTGNWGSAPLPSIRRGLCRLSLAWAKIKIRKSKDGFCWMHTAFAPLLSQKRVTSKPSWVGHHLCFILIQYIQVILIRWNTVCMKGTRESSPLGPQTHSGKPYSSLPVTSRDYLMLTKGLMGLKNCP